MLDGRIRRHGNEAIDFNSDLAVNVVCDTYCMGRGNERDWIGEGKAGKDHR